MTKFKTFKKVTMLVAWFNKPDNEYLDLKGIVHEGQEIHAVYTDPITSESRFSPETVAKKTNLQDRIETHLAYPKTTKRKLKFPESIIDFQVVPFARIHNSIRNLKPFKGMGPKALTEWMESVLPDLGYRVITRSVASEEYGTDATLIEVL